MRLSIPIADDVVSYAEASARLRKTSLTDMMRRVVDTVLRDQMILAILDDADNVVAPKPVPATHLERARVLHATAKVATFNTESIPIYRKKKVLTREELRRELSEAVRNTASMPVE